MTRWICFCAVLAAACHHESDSLALGAPGATFGPFAGLAPGMTIEQVRAAAPVVTIDVDRGNAFAIADWHSATGSGSLYFHDGRIEMIAMVPHHLAMADVTTAWGPGTDEPGAKPAYTTHRYLDAAAHVRCDVTDDVSFPVAMEWRAYRSTAELFGGAPDALGGVRVVGRPIAEVEPALAAAGLPLDDAAPDLRFVHMPFTELGRPPTVSLEVRDGTVTRVSALVVIDHPAGRDALLAMMTQKLGAPASTADGIVRWAHAQLGDGDRHVIALEWFTDRRGASEAWPSRSRSRRGRSRAAGAASTSPTRSARSPRATRT
jgi:hypothetical protein